MACCDLPSRPSDAGPEDAATDWRRGMTRDELAETYGMRRFRCPRCQRSNYADGAPECPCGWTDVPEEEEEDECQK
jgi:hypothetical protein